MQSHQANLEIQNHELRKKQRQLELALEWQTNLYDFAPVGYLSLDRDGIIRELNLTAATLLGQDRSSLENTSILSRLTEETSRDLLNHLVFAFESNTQSTGEFILKPDIQGKTRELRLDSKVRIDPNGVKICLTTLIDITQQKLAETKLQTSEENYRLLFNNVDELLSVFDREGVCQFMNLRIAALFGGEPEDFLGKSLCDFYPKMAATYLKRIRDSIDSGIPRYYEDEVALPQGRRWLFSRIQPLPDAYGDCQIALIASQDITDRRLAERAMHRNEERLKALINATTNDVVVLLDSDFMMEIVNERAARGFGKTVEEVVGRPLGEFMPPSIASKRREYAQQVIDTGQSVRFEDQRAGHWFDNNMCPVFDDEGQPQAVAIFARDITQRKKMEHALAKAKEAAEKANLAKSRFLAAANHDLRQPLQAMRLLLESLSLYELEPRISEVVEDMGEAMQFMEGLLHALLDISKLEAGSVVPKKKNFHIIPFFHQLRGQFKATAKDAGKRIRMFPVNAILHTDPILLARILHNFITNALRHTRGDRILVGCRYAENYRRIEVWDDGPGIPNDQLDKIFEEFFQIGNPARNLNQGLGLGLAITKRLAELLELRLAVKSIPGKGSMFSVEVPLGRKNEPEAVRNPPSSRSPVRHKGLILAVDDDPIVLKATRRLLEALRYDVICASSAEEAFDLVEQHGHLIRLALLDYRLPSGWDGIRLLQQIRKRTNRELPAVLISGDTTIDSLHEVRLSDLPLLHKPIDPAVLRRHLEDAMNNTG